MMDSVNSPQAELNWQFTKAVSNLGDLFIEMQILDKQRLSFETYADIDSGIFWIKWNLKESNNDK